MKNLVAAVVAFVVAVTVIGFYVAGSPFTQRERRFDQKRVRDLESLQSEIICYWRAHKRLPDRLAQIGDDTSGFEVPRDPETGVEYEYRVNSATDFDLCAKFHLASDDNEVETYWGYYDPNFKAWRHPAGHRCFHRKVSDAQVFRSERCGRSDGVAGTFIAPSGGG